jgi:hypothetical protein
MVTLKIALPRKTVKTSITNAERTLAFLSRLPTRGLDQGMQHERLLLIQELSRGESNDRATKENASSGSIRGE